LPIWVFAQESLQKGILLGLTPEINVFDQSKRYNQLFKYLTRKTGIKIDRRVLSQYGDVIDNYKALRLDGAFLGSFTAVLALNKLNLEPIARPVNLDGSSTYHGLIIVRKDSGIKNVKDMKGKTIAMVAKATTAGFISPIAYLKENSVTDINGYFKECYFAGSHDNVVYDVLDKKADIGAMKNTVYDRLINENPRIKIELTILAESKEVPSNGLLLKKSLDKDMRKKLQETLLNMDKDAAGIKVLERLGVRKFIETSDKDYEVVLDIARNAGIDLNSFDYTVD
jgi:phosphonate transport system substrate-binding protein